MNVYIVISGCYSDTCIEAVFLNERKAELYCAIHNKSQIDDYRIEEFETADDNIEGDENIIGYLYSKYSTDCESIICTKEYFERYYKYKGDYVWLKTKDVSKAKKFCEDRAAETVKSVGYEEFKEFISKYPRKLEVDVCHIFCPPFVTYQDFSDGKTYPESLVASHSWFDNDPASPFYVPESERRYTIYKRSGIE